MTTRKRAPRLVVDRATSVRLGRIRQHGTAAELLVRRLAWELGVRFRTTNRDLPGSPDLANRTKSWVVFVHGCYWHGHVGCTRATIPKRNRRFWITKFADNRARDRRVVAALRRRGFRVLVVWECELSEPERVRKKLETVVA